MRPAAIIILLMIMVSLFVVPSSASSVTITIEHEQAKAKLVLSLQQNMTQLPNQTSTLNMASDGNLSSAFTNALKGISPYATPSDLTLNLDSTGTSLNITATLTVSGVSERRGDILAVDMAWKAFNISSDLRAGNLSYNKMGYRYFLPVAAYYTNASRFVGRPNATITGVSFFINKTSVDGRVAENELGNFTIFDFRGLNASLEGWSRTYSLSNNTTTWRYTPQPIDISISVQRMNRTTTDMFARYGYNAEITVLGIARAKGNTLLLDIGTGQKEWIMVGIVGVTVILAIVAQLLFRAKKKKYVKFGRW